MIYVLEAFSGGCVEARGNEWMNADCYGNSPGERIAAQTRMIEG